MAKVKSCKDFLMLLLYARGHTGEQHEPIAGKTRLMKMVFLFDKEIRRQFNLEKAIPAVAMPDFVNWNYGPFSSDVYRDLQFLVNMGFVNKRALGTSMTDEEEIAENEYWQASGNGENEDDADDYTTFQFYLSSIGEEFVESGEAGELTDSQWETLDEFKRRCTATSLKTLLRYVYTKYPETTTKSKIKKDVLGE